jgi:hypothetical protein
MRFPSALRLTAILGCLLAAVASAAQTELVSSTFFPADSEFKELLSIRSETDLRDAKELGRLEHGRVLLEAGLTRYGRRVYSLAGEGSLEVEVFTFEESRGSYSLLTLLSDANIQSGPPGSSFSTGGGSLLFVAGNRFARIRSSREDDLARRVAVSVSNRIGPRDPSPPNLLRHLPEDHCGPSSVRYLLGPAAAASFGIRVAGAVLQVPPAVEVVQAHCTSQGAEGTLTILSFPTIALAEDYFGAAELVRDVRRTETGLFIRQTGPLVGLLEGNLAAESADKTLGAIEFSYSIKWIFDRANQRPRALWGVPVRILGTVVRSILFTVLLSLLSIVAGVVLAAVKIYVRRRWVHGEKDAFIRLKINED